MTMFLDIETSGLPPVNSNWRKDFKVFPHVVSITWKVNSVMNDYIVCDHSYEIPKEVSKIHGITTQTMWSSKHHPLEVFEHLAKDLNVCRYVVGHNIYFDSSIIKANALRYFGQSLLTNEIDDGLFKDKRIDTMRIGQKLTKKWPTLTELHIKLFGKAFENTHTSKGDVEAVEKCYNELKRLKLV